MNLVKSKKRVADHGEVFTPAWLVEAMLDLVKDESERIDSRWLRLRSWPHPQRQRSRLPLKPTRHLFLIFYW
jgi:hypothetical protein